MISNSHLDPNANESVRKDYPAVTSFAVTNFRTGFRSSNARTTKRKMESSLTANRNLMWKWPKTLRAQAKRSRWTRHPTSARAQVGLHPLFGIRPAHICSIVLNGGTEPRPGAADGSVSGHSTSSALADQIFRAPGYAEPAVRRERLGLHCPTCRDPVHTPPNTLLGIKAMVDALRDDLKRAEATNGGSPGPVVRASIPVVVDSSGSSTDHPYACNKCSESFTTRTLLRTHEASRHPPPASEACTSFYFS